MGDSGPLPVVEELVRPCSVIDRPVAFAQDDPSPPSRESERGRQPCKSSAEHCDVSSKRCSWHGVDIIDAASLTDNQ